jgi:hypothetical protein
MLPMAMTRAFQTFAAASLVVAVSACSDQGAVRSQAREPQPSPASVAPAAAPARVPMISSRGEAAPAATQAPPLPPVPEGAGTGDRALDWTVPSGWTPEKPSSSMRRAQYRVPGSAGDGECAVFYFGPGQGGDPMANAERWASQFTNPDGSPARGSMKTSEIDAGGLKVVLVEIAGTYSGGMTMTAEPAVPEPGYRLLGAIAPGPDANWFFKLTGPDATINAQRAAFVSMVRSLKRGAS